MAFVLHSNPTIRQIARIALDCHGDPLGGRILKQTLPVALAIDEVRDAYAFSVSATSRHNSLQSHFMMFFMGQFFHIRSMSIMSDDVCLYDFPKALEAKRADVQQCFIDAMAVYGRAGKAIQGPLDRFEPHFVADDWEPPDF